MHHSAVYHVMQRGKPADLNNLLTMGYTFYPDDLDVAIESGNVLIAQMLLQKYCYDINLQSVLASKSAGMINLVLSSYGHNLNLTELITLIANRHDLTSLHLPVVLDLFDDLPLQFISQNFTDGVKLLLETKRDKISSHSIIAGFNLAVASGSLSMVKIFLEKTPDIITKVETVVMENTRLHHILKDRQLI